VSRHALEPDEAYDAIYIANRKANVFVGDGKDPCLVVNLLNDRKTGLVGLWVGNNSGGDFANLSIIPAA
jgi:hypothetical protein